ncbi:calmodulin-dependent protein kinase [Gigaspora margarita]|uniref:Calmodulin-dependent protein kinase n=1 Tax=Gigaspora margarita TaxID=4874 RepID=A0A8H4AYE0_GIGMA|nr:calmodulin-dependent protein kinase [Gigaspora margarita]
MGDAAAISGLGFCYQNGIGVEKDGQKAFEYYQKSANMGNSEGTRMVGFCYQNGIGVEKDEQKAFEYYQESADMGIC